MCERCCGTGLSITGLNFQCTSCNISTEPHIFYEFFNDAAALRGINHTGFKSCNCVGCVSVGYFSSEDPEKKLESPLQYDLNLLRARAINLSKYRPLTDREKTANRNGPAYKEALHRYRDKRERRRTGPPPCLYKNRSKYASCRPRFKGRFVKQTKYVIPPTNVI